MAFDLQRILRALLFSTSEALTIRDFQAVITRYHEQEAEAKAEEEADETFDDEAPRDESGATENGSQEAVASGDGRSEAENPPPEKTTGGTEASAAVAGDVQSGVPSLVTATQLREALDAIRTELDNNAEVYQLIEGHNGYRLVTRAEFAPWIRCLRGDPRPARLSQAALETLAIVAYRQPTTRAEIESIRGVSADGALNKLLERELIEVKGRAELPGRPIQYGVSEKFFEFVGIKSIEELPASDVLSPREIDKWIQEASKEHVLSDREVGLPEE